jgi:uncharacterized protein YjbI with pentapeptide repeats
LNRLEEKQQQGNLTPQEEQELSSVLRVISDAENTISQQRQIAAASTRADPVASAESFGNTSTTDVLPEYAQRQQEIKNSSLNDKDKAEALYELNKDLLKLTDKQLQDAAATVVDNPEDEAARKKMEELAALKKVKEAEALEQKRQAAGNNPDDVRYQKEQPHNGNLANHNLSAFDKQFAKSDKQQQVVSRNETLVENTETDKQRKAAEGRLNSSEKKLAAADKKLVDPIAQNNKSAFDRAAERVKTMRPNARLLTDENPDAVVAQNAEQSAFRKFETAEQIRKDAEKQKNAVEKSKMLKTASGLEQEAIRDMNRAADMYDSMRDNFYVPGAITSRSGLSPVIGDVSEDPDSRLSEKLFRESAQLKREARSQEQTAVQLRDSANKTKKATAKTDLLRQSDDAMADARSTQARSDRAYQAGLNAQGAEEAQLLAQSAKDAPQAMDARRGEDIRRYDEYKKHYELMLNLREARERFATSSQDVLDLRKRLARRQADYEDQQRIGAQAKTPEEKQAAEDELQMLLRELKEIEIRLGEAEQTLTDARNNLEIANAEVDAHLASSGSAKAADMVALTGRNGDNLPQPLEVKRTNPLDPNFKVPEVIEEPIFVRSEVPVYNAENPIPIDGPCPQGLVYKVQVGAFRNPIRPEVFADFVPLSGQRMENGVIRYMVGYFRTYQEANEAKNIILRMDGYPGAFVVAYNNCDKITVAEARRIQAAGGVQDVALNVGANNQQANNQQANNQQANNQQANNQQANNQQANNQQANNQQANNQQANNQQANNQQANNQQANNQQANNQQANNQQANNQQANNQQANNQQANNQQANNQQANNQQANNQQANNQQANNQQANNQQANNQQGMQLL